MKRNECRIKGGGGYDIPCVHTLDGGEQLVCVVLHGFGSSKTSPTATMLLDALPDRGIGVLAFDFPAHGDSPAGGEALRLGRCLEDLAAAEAYALSAAPGARLVRFASSFGAYICLIDLSLRKSAVRKAFLRSAAVNMPELFIEYASRLAATSAEYGYFTPETAHAEPLKITRGFLDDLRAHDLFRLYRPGPAAVRMVHGDADETIPAGAAVRFAERFGVPLTLIPGGDHRLSVPGAADEVLRLALDFFRDGEAG
jgi:pimeloyl-ACP methyl ester carboxylesterase